MYYTYVRLEPPKTNKRIKVELDIKQNTDLKKE